MPAQNQKPLPLSKLRPIVRRARFIAEYVQGTMGLEGQGLDRARYRKLVKQSFAEGVRASA